MNTKDFAELKWYQKPLFVLTVVILSPLIIIGTLIAGIAALWDKLRQPHYKRLYEASDYYKDLGVAYTPWVYRSEEYKLYNAARGLGLELIRGETTYAVFEGKVFLLPDHIVPLIFSREDGRWFADLDSDEVVLLDKVFEEKCALVLPQHRALPAYLLIADDMVCCDDDPDQEEGPVDGAVLQTLPDYVRHGKTLFSALTDGDDMDEKNIE